MVLREAREVADKHGSPRRTAIITEKVRSSVCHGWWPGGCWCTSRFFGALVQWGACVLCAVRLSVLEPAINMVQALCPKAHTTSAACTWNNLCCCGGAWLLACHGHRIKLSRTRR